MAQVDECGRLCRCDALRKIVGQRKLFMLRKTRFNQWRMAIEERKRGLLLLGAGRAGVCKFVGTIELSFRGEAAVIENAAGECAGPLEHELVVKKLERLAGR